MADTKISALTGATTPLAGTEELPLVQSSTTKKATVANIQAAPVASGTANGVQFLDGSKVPTTSSRLTFDGAEIFKNSGGTVQYNDIIGSAAAATRHSAGGTLGTDSLDLFQNGAGGFLVNRAATPLNIGTNNNNSDIVIDTSGNAAFNRGNLVQGTAAKGINFTANTPASGMTSQLLNWYEEGVVTAAITTTSGSITLNASFNKIKYTRIGRSVSITGVLYVDSVSTPGGAATITGLPFANGSAKSNVAGVCIFATGLAVTATTAIQGRIEDSATGIILEKFTAGASTSIVGDIQAATQFKLNATYFV